MTWINPIQSTFWKKKSYLKTCFCNFFRSQNVKEDSIITGVFYPFSFFLQHNQVYMKMLFLTQFKLIQSTFNLWLLFISNMSSPFLFCFMCILELFIRHSNPLFTFSVPFFLEVLADNCSTIAKNCCI